MSASPRRALVVIDVQNEYVTGNLPIEFPPVDVSLPNIAKAMDAASAAGIPVVVVQNIAPADSPLFASGSHGAALHDAVATRPHALLLEKALPSAFAGTGLGQWLEANHIDTLTLAGYMTHNCDAATAFEATHRGLQVELLSDATGSVPYANDAGSANAQEIHRVFSVVLHSRFAAVATTERWVAAVQASTRLERGNIEASNALARERRSSSAGPSCNMPVVSMK